MRLLIICLLFTATVAAQTDTPPVVQYIWAESGLTLRAAGRADAEKIMTIPFGEAVTLTGQNGHYLEVTALPAVDYKAFDGDRRSDAYVMKADFVGVKYSGKEGFVYAGYLSYLDPNVPEDSGRVVSLEDWLEAVGGEPRVCNDKRRRFTDGWGNDIGDRTLQYANGISFTERLYDGGGESTLLIPFATLNDGYLIAEKWYGVAQTVKQVKKNDDKYMDGEMLKVQEDGSLLFQGELSQLHIRVVGGVLIIHSEGGC